MTDCAPFVRRTFLASSSVVPVVVTSSIKIMCVLCIPPLTPKLPCWFFIRSLLVFVTAWRRGVLVRISIEVETGTERRMESCCAISSDWLYPRSSFRIRGIGMGTNV